MAKNKLFVNEYRKRYSGQKMAVAVDTRVLEQNYKNILDNIRFLTREEVNVTLLHNSRSTAVKRNLEQEQVEPFFLGGTQGASDAFEKLSMQRAEDLEAIKLILLERRKILDVTGELVALVTDVNSDMVSDNVSHDVEERVKGILERLHRSKHLMRVHIVDGKEKDAIKNEVYSLEGVGTMLLKTPDDYTPGFSAATPDDARLIKSLIDSYKGEGYIMPRNLEYIMKHIDSFYKATLDGIFAGCVEAKQVDNDTVELAALASVERFLGNKVGKSLMSNFFDVAKKDGYKNVLIVTANPVLVSILLKVYGCEELTDPESCTEKMKDRMDKSPGRKFFIKKLR